MPSVADFYNTLLASEIAVFGIIAAVLFVFVQMAYTQLSFKGVSFIFRNRFLWVSILFSVATVLFTATGSLLLSFPSFDFVPQLNLGSRTFYQNGHVGLAALSLFLTSIVLFIVLVIRYGQNLRPSRVALLIGSQIQPKQVRDYLLRRYGVPNPDSYTYLVRLHKSFGVDDQIGFVRLRLEGIEQSETEEKKKERDRKLKVVEQKIAAYRKIYKTLTEKQGEIEDPLAALAMLLVRAIDSFDISTVEDAVRLINSISDNFIGTYQKEQIREPWDPNDQIARNYVDYLLGHLRLQFEHCDKNQYQHAKSKLLQMTQHLGRLLVMNKLANEARPVLDFWKQIADQSIGRAAQSFCEIIRYYDDVFEHLMDRKDDTNQELLDEVFRHIGWLGERVLSKVGVEEKPLMRDDGFYNEYDCIMEPIFSYSHAIDEKRPDGYPLIFFDAIWVVIRQLARILRTAAEDRSARLQENLFSLIYRFSSFASAAIRQANSRGAGLAVVRLKGSYDLLSENGLDELAEDLISVLAELGGNVAGAGDRLTSVDFLGKAIDDYIIDTVSSAAHTRKVAEAALEVLIRGWGEHAKRWKYLKKLGARMRTNFSLNFDWRTGEDGPGR